jgi:S1-C subfamily serine protease
VKFKTLFFAFQSSFMFCSSFGAQPDAPREPISALSKMQTRAEQGDSQSQYLLGLLFLTGEGFPKDMARALHWLELSAGQGHSFAQNIVGMLYDPIWFGIKGKKGIALAEKFYRSSAAQNNSSAISNLSEMRKRGYISEVELVTPSPNGMLSSVLQRALPLEPTALARAEGASAQSVTPGAEFLEGRESAASIHSKFGGSIAEIIGDAQYGSGSVVGELKVQNGDSSLHYNNKPEGALVEFFTEIVNSKKLKEPFKQVLKTSTKYLVISTNAHVAEQNTKIIVGLGSDSQGNSIEKANAEGVCFSTGEFDDLALLIVPLTEKIEKLNLRKFFLPEVAAVPPGTRVFTFANPRQLSRTISQGIVSANRTEGIQFDASISTGSSGGALLSEKGDLLGTIVGYIGGSADQNLNFAIPAGALVQMLEGNQLECELF